MKLLQSENGGRGPGAGSAAGGGAVREGGWGGGR